LILVKRHGRYERTLVAYEAMCVRVCVCVPATLIVIVVSALVVWLDIEVDIPRLVDLDQLESINCAWSIHYERVVARTQVSAIDVVGSLLAP